MNSRMLWSRILKVVGCVAMMLGTLDPMEGSLLILPGCGLVALAMYLGGRDRRRMRVPTVALALLAGKQDRLTCLARLLT